MTLSQHDSFNFELIANFYLSLYRSKSRSVDHGLSAPFVDLDSLRSKVEGRFESIDRLSSRGDFFLFSQ